MAKKAFFAAFIVDEETYTPEPGPVDHHFVAADLAQSNFGEQPGVSNIIVWNSAADLIADHRQRGPLTVDYLSGDHPAPNRSVQRTLEACPSSRWNRTDDVCVANAANLSTRSNDVATPHFRDAPSFRHQLSSIMRDALAFEYYEVRPCIESDSKVTSYRDKEEFGAELAKFQTERREFRAFWSLYGVDRNATTAIGDFVSKDTAHDVMNAILAIPAAARNALQGVRPEGNKSRNGMEQAARSAADWLDDMINQSSNDQRV